MQNWEALLTKAAEGESGALDLLLAHYGPTIRQRIEGKISLRWQSVLTPDDVMQQTYADAIQSIRRFTPNGLNSFLSWLYIMAERNLQDAVKALKASSRGGNRHQIRPDGIDGSVLALAELAGLNTNSPSREAARKEMGETISSALGKLPDRYRQALHMYFLEEQSMKEVAVVLGCSHGAALMLRARAIDQLREILGTASKFT